MHKLNVAIMSSYDEMCGIAAYTDRLISHLHDVVNVTLLKNRPFRKVPCRHYDNVKECECFDVTIWTNNIFFDSAKACAAIQDADVLHVEFESALYYQEWMLPFLDTVRSMGIPVVMTAHSSCIWGILYSKVDRWIAHSSTLASQINGKWIHMPIVFSPYQALPTNKKIVSFGLGRNQDSLVEEAISKVRLEHPGLTFEPHYAHKRWVLEAELIDYLLSGRIITLLYPPTAALVNSSAAAFALGVSRPLIITGTSWFSTIMETFNGEHGVLIANTVDSVAGAIIKCLHKNDLDISNEFDRRKSTAILSRMGMAQVVEEHLNLYREVLK